MVYLVYISIYSILLKKQPLNDDDSQCQQTDNIYRCKL